MNRLLLFSLLVAAGGYCRAAVILSVSPASQTVPLGSTAEFAVCITGLGNGTAVGTYDINLGFDPSILSYGSVVFGSQLDLLGLGDIQVVTPGVGSVEAFELSLDSATDINSRQASAFRLVTFTFDTLSPAANSPVTLSVNALGDAFGNSIGATVQGASISVNSATGVPEPGTWWFFLAALPVFAIRVGKLPRPRA